ncbi:hypothetical protein KP509_08G000300 [Ceratopteris richardii]|uniref:LNS2/PITP domain-containing protein n=1 Tax=Ceratopteris richardii TaxID=49495 RepID=A0A8T2UDE2_CERRI|nr:hypothetical protein KP509_08G000300 [Ceratopteris richardii]KAH7430480.1 hypothetical protein KP509_08G000300 [Ceratopteris richardii]
MYGFGMLGSYFSQGVYAVTGPFQGAVDIIVVQQEDGSFKSSPWYVKCGDFQGVLKNREKVVDIAINGAPADFYMLLNSRGEAYFEMESEDSMLASSSSSLSTSSAVKERANEKLGGFRSLNCGPIKGDSLVDQVMEQSALNSSSGRSQLDDQLSLKSETKNVDSGKGNITSMEPDNPQACVSKLESTQESSKTFDFELELNPVILEISGENLVLAEARDPAEEKQQYGQAFDVGSGLERSDQSESSSVLHNEISNSSSSIYGTDEARIYSFNSVTSEGQDASTYDSHVNNALLSTGLAKFGDVEVTDVCLNNAQKDGNADKKQVLNSACQLDSVPGMHADAQSRESLSSSVPNFVPSNVSALIAKDLVSDTSDVAKEINNRETPTTDMISGKDVTYTMYDNLVVEASKTTDIQTIAVVPPPSRWTTWSLPFSRSKEKKASVSEEVAKKESLVTVADIAVESPLTEPSFTKSSPHELTQRPRIRSYVPTSAQIESLKLKSGPNKVTFTFPRVLGRTQVDANIFLWKWDTRIVISDVDGTITKSDVLGQFMPLVGRDWSQSGVTRLFSAIKENGYEVLFLSARAISQAYLTRQFLINLKQDGEALPRGPVFISPDGLIPSLYREVVRRTPHEFKISCLEGIRRLFPEHVNPFYAGFGNRDTDEISYLKVGIPKGKIFIINPKGEVIVNHHVDVKSYTSIHALVNDMFPPVSLSEQEDFNSWNYWKLLLPDVSDEIAASAKSIKEKKSTSSKR